MKLVALLFLILGIAVSPVLARDQSVADTRWQEFIKDQHAFYCDGRSGVCNACTVYSGGQPLGQCKTTETGPLGSECRCGSSEGWLKGWIVQIDPVIGWIDRRGEPVRKKR